MMDSNKMPPAAVIAGGDIRMRYAGEALQEAGYSLLCAPGGGAIPNADSTEAVTEAMAAADLLLLPMPLTRDGTHLNAPLARTPIPLSAIADALRPGTRVAGGMLPPAFARRLEEGGAVVFDYAADQRLQAQNAISTAEGAIAMAMGQTADLLYGQSAAVVGYGRIGKALAARLRALGMQVTILARSAGQRAEARAAGLAAADLADVAKVLPTAAMIFHTVPARVIDYTKAALPAHAMIFDLAPIYPASDVPQIIPAPGIPGKYAPRFAGRLIAEAVLCWLKEVGI